MTELFDGVLARGAVRDATGDAAWLRAMLDVEAALAGALADVGVITPTDAAAVADACDAALLDPRALGVAASAAGNPVVPLVRVLTGSVPGDAAAHVHRGATSQDVLDSAAMLVARRALEPLLADLRAAADAAAALTRHHADTPVAGRTLLQQAVPTTFGLKAAGWMVALDAAVERLDTLRLPVQLGGAAGTLESLGEHGPAVLTALAARLGLAEPTLPWHAQRTPVAELAGALGQAAVAIGKPAGDVVLLAQTELAEVSTAATGESSTMPHKRNPVAAVAARAGALQAPGLVSTLLSAGILQEHERAAGGWHAEWRPFTELLRTVGSAAAWLADCLGGLHVDPGAMREDLLRGGALLVSERVTTALTPGLGRLVAHDVVSAATARAQDESRPLAQVLDEDERVPLRRSQLDVLLDPTREVHTTRALIARALQRRGAADG